MITSPRRPTLSPPVTRHFEFTRLQDQSIALAYQALIPVVSRPPGTAAISTRRQRPATTTPRSPIQGRGSLTSHDQSRSPRGDLCPGLRRTAGQGGHDRQPARGGRAANRAMTAWTATPSCASSTTASAGASWPARASSGSGTRPPPGPSTASTSSIRIGFHANMPIRSCSSRNSPVAASRSSSCATPSATAPRRTCCSRSRA